MHPKDINSFRIQNENAKTYSVCIKIPKKNVLAVGEISNAEVQV